jgi:hypothetical protein
LDIIFTALLSGFCLLQILLFPFYIFENIINSCPHSAYPCSKGIGATAISCGRQFNDLADMQKHTLIEHIQKGDIPEE